MTETLTITGGATLPSGGLPLSASIPLARLRADRDGVTILIRPRWLGALVVRMQFVSEVEGAAGWSASWEEIDRVLVTRRAVFFVPRERLGARFVVGRRRRLAPLHDLLAEKGIPVGRVFTTIGKSLWIR